MVPVDINVQKNKFNQNIFDVFHAINEVQVWLLVILCRFRNDLS